MTIALLELLRHSDHPRIVNVSGGMGGITEVGGWSPGHRASKAAMNAMTRILATELKDAGLIVNSACPGFVKPTWADLWAPGSRGGTAPPVSSGWRRSPMRGPTGGFFRDGKPIAF